MSKPLITIASERESAGVIDALCLRRAPGFALLAQAREPGTGLYRGDRCDLVVSGVFDHHMLAACALALETLPARPSSIVNFGAVGSYHGLTRAAGEIVDAPGIGEVVAVSRVCRFDVDDNVHWARPVSLEVIDSDLVAPALRCVVCVSGSRYSTDADRRSSYFPGEAQVEDMELYGLAVFAATLSIPLYSVKYVTNIVAPDGVDSFRENVVRWRGLGETALLELVSKLQTRTG